MNRRRFLRLIGLGAVVTAIAPKMLAEETPVITWSEPIVTDFCKKITEMKPNRAPLDEIIRIYEGQGISENDVIELPYNDSKYIVSNNTLLEWTKDVFSGNTGTDKPKLYVYSCETYNKFAEAGFPEDRMILQKYIPTIND